MEDDKSQTLAKIKNHLHILKLYKMKKALDEQLARGARENLPVSQLIERLLAIEANASVERRIERRIRDSKLPERKLLADFDFQFQTGVDRSQIMELATLSFVERKEGLEVYHPNPLRMYGLHKDSLETYLEVYLPEGMAITMTSLYRRILAVSGQLTRT